MRKRTSAISWLDDEEKRHTRAPTTLLIRWRWYSRQQTAALSSFYGLVDQQTGTSEELPYRSLWMNVQRTSRMFCDMSGSFDKVIKKKTKPCKLTTPFCIIENFSFPDCKPHMHTWTTIIRSANEFQGTTRVHAGSWREVCLFYIIYVIATMLNCLSNAMYRPSFHCSLCSVFTPMVVAMATCCYPTSMICPHKGCLHYCVTLSTFREPVIPFEPTKELYTQWRGNDDRTKGNTGIVVIRD